MSSTPLSAECESVLAEISQALDLLRSAAKSAAELIQNTEGSSVNDSCELAAALNRAKAEAKELYELVSGDVIERMGSMPEHILSDGTVVERRQATARKKWDHLTLAKSVTEKLNQMAIDMDTGEMTMSHQEIAIRLLDYVAPSYWRVKKLADLGINADMYCEVTDGGINLIIRKGGTSDDE
ncbi:MAG: hypothetical protein EBT80_00185 [Chitinophagales bacterium]|nr:hypothetical protein [Chitinophagales bacterium]